jgi:DNA-binding response OmpR family regulator
MNKTILCVEDNMAVQMLNKPLLEAKGYTVKMATTLVEAWAVINSEMPALIILDIHLPDGNGLDFLRELRNTSDIPVIALTNNKEEQDIIAGFKSGCDSYMPKPHSLSVLLAQIEALLRRVEVSAAIVKETITLETNPNKTYINGIAADITGKEFDVLLLLMKNEGQTVSIEYLYEKIWNQPLVEDKSALRTIKSRLSSKIKPAGYTIESDYGKGYVFKKIK